MGVALLTEGSLLPRLDRAGKVSVWLSLREMHRLVHTRTERWLIKTQTTINQFENHWSVDACV